MGAAAEVHPAGRSEVPLRWEVRLGEEGTPDTAPQQAEKGAGVAWLRLGERGEDVGRGE